MKKLNKAERTILVLMVMHDKEWTGLELIKAAKETRKASSTLKKKTALLRRGTIYVHLYNLEEEGYITSKTKPLVIEGAEKFVNPNCLIDEKYYINTRHYTLTDKSLKIFQLETSSTTPMQCTAIVFARSNVNFSLFGL